MHVVGHYKTLLEVVPAKTVTVMLCVALLLSVSANAQKGATSISLGPSIGWPLNFNDNYKTGFGAGFRGYYGLNEIGSLLVNVYLIEFKPSELSNRLGLSGIKVGYLSFVNATRKFFIYADFGFAYSSGDIFAGTSTALALSAGPGYSIPLGKKGHIDIIASSNVTFNRGSKNWVDLYLAYRLDLNKK